MISEFVCVRLTFSSWFPFSLWSFGWSDLWLNTEFLLEWWTGVLAAGTAYGLAGCPLSELGDQIW